jgi:hypothetical protein
VVFSEELGKSPTMSGKKILSRLVLITFILCLDYGCIYIYIYIYSLLFIGLWIIGAPTGVYLALFARPMYNLEGYWLGLITGGGLVCSILIVIMGCFDWKKIQQRILRRAKQYSAEKEKEETIHTMYNNNNNNNHNLLLQSEVILFGDPAMVNIHTCHFGGFEFMKSYTFEDEIIELEIDLDDDEEHRLIHSSS